MRDKTLVRFRQFDFTIFPQNEKYKYCSKYSRYCHQEEYIVYHLVLLPSLQMREHIMQMHVDFSFYQALAFQVLILIPYKQNVAQAYKVRILFAKDFFGVKKHHQKFYISVQLLGCTSSMELQFPSRQKALGRISTDCKNNRQNASMQYASSH